MMRRFYLTRVLACTLAVIFVTSSIGFAATEQDKQAAIDAGLAYLADTMSTYEFSPGNFEGYWSYANNGTLAATGSAALAFIEKGYLPGNDVVIDGVNYGDVVGKAANYVFNRATSITITPQTYGDPENYVSSTVAANGKGIYFNPGSSSRNVYTTGIVAPVVSALGNAYTPDTVVGRGNATVAAMTYREVMRDVVDWFSYGQNDTASVASGRGGWHYDANYSSSDNSTAQWGGLTILYGQDWGLDTPQFVKNELSLWVDHVQNDDNPATSWRAGGSGYSHDTQYVNAAKTGGLLLELAAIGAPVTDPRVQNAIGYLESTTSFDHWNQGAQYSSDQWYGGHIGNPYAMWAVYKALKTYGVNDIATAPGGFTIGQNWDPQLSPEDDWYSQYCDWLVANQLDGGSIDGGYWNGYQYWNGALAAGWNINILNAAGVPEPIIPAPGAVLLGAMGLGMVGWMKRRKKQA